ncbi:MAG: hypothetical protein M1827_005487 [Pycnora praestabilis]|nr:MAG: hypothetical protein M1827_005487 [Pycnora praestabilis]
MKGIHLEPQAPDDVYIRNWLAQIKEDHQEFGSFSAVTHAANGLKQPTCKRERRLDTSDKTCIEVEQEKPRLSRTSKDVKDEIWRHSKGISPSSYISGRCRNFTLRHSGRFNSTSKTGKRNGTTSHPQSGPHLSDRLSQQAASRGNEGGDEDQEFYNPCRRHKRLQSSSESSFLETGVATSGYPRTDNDQAFAGQGRSRPHDLQKVKEYSDSRSDDPSVPPSEAGEATGKYERKARRKTRQDLYEPKIGLHKRESRLRRGKKRSSKRGLKGRSRIAMDENFKANNISQDRLTLKSTQNLGLFKNGRASSPIRRRGLPDLAFSEMRFLRNRKDHNTDRMVEKVDHNRSKRQKKDKELTAEEEISSYFTFTGKPHTQRNALMDRNIDVHYLNCAFPSQHTSKDCRRGLGESSRVISTNPIVELPQKPFLGMGTRGTHPRAPSRSCEPLAGDAGYGHAAEMDTGRSMTGTTYFTWSISSVSSHTARQPSSSLTHEPRDPPEQTTFGRAATVIEVGQLKSELPPKLPKIATPEKHLVESKARLTSLGEHEMDTDKVARHQQAPRISKTPDHECEVQRTPSSRSNSKVAHASLQPPSSSFALHEDHSIDHDGSCMVYPQRDGGKPLPTLATLLQSCETSLSLPSNAMPLDTHSPPKSEVDVAGSRDSDAFTLAGPTLGLRKIAGKAKSGFDHFQTHRSKSQPPLAGFSRSQGRSTSLKDPGSHRFLTPDQGQTTHDQQNVHLPLIVNNGLEYNVSRKTITSSNFPKMEGQESSYDDGNHDDVPLDVPLEVPMSALPQETIRIPRLTVQCPNTEAISLDYEGLRKKDNARLDHMLAEDKELWCSGASQGDQNVEMSQALGNLYDSDNQFYDLDNDCNATDQPIFGEECYWPDVDPGETSHVGEEDLQTPWLDNGVSNRGRGVTPRAGESYGPSMTSFWRPHRLY